MTTYTPDQIRANRRRLVDELPKYPQTTGLLRDSSGYCCLGVACDLFNPKAWEDSYTEPGYSFLGEFNHLPQEVTDFYGFQELDENVEATEPPGRGCGSPQYWDSAHEEWRAFAEDLNDNLLMTFKNIARLMEEAFAATETGIAERTTPEVRP